MQQCLLCGRTQPMDNMEPWPQNHEFNSRYYQCRESASCQVRLAARRQEILVGPEEVRAISTRILARGVREEG